MIRLFDSSMLAAGLSLVLVAGLLTDFIYKSAVGINIMVLVVSGGGAPRSRQVTLQWRRCIYKTAVIIDMMVVVVGGW